MARKKQKGTNLGKNPFMRAMISSVENAGTICAAILNALYDARLTDSRILDLYNYFLPLNTAVQNIIIALSGDMIRKKGATNQIEMTQEGLQPFIHAIFLAIENVYAKGTVGYKRLLAGGTASFYKVSKNGKLTRLNALNTAIGTDVSLAAVKVLVEDLIEQLGGDIKAQSTEIFHVKTDSASVKTAVANAANGVWYVYHGLMMVYTLDPALALALLPMEFIYKASKQTSKKVYVPKASIRKILSHLFKIGETITMKNNGTTDLWVGFAETVKDGVKAWYLLPAGETVTAINYNVLGDVTFKFVMVKNSDLTTSGDITFSINKK